MFLVHAAPLHHMTPDSGYVLEISVHCQSPGGDLASSMGRRERGQRSGAQSLRPIIFVWELEHGGVGSSHCTSAAYVDP